MAGRKRLPWPLRLPFRLLMSPIQKPGMFRLVFVALNGSPREISGRARAVLLLRKMNTKTGLTVAQANRLIHQLNTYPRALWTDKIPISYVNERGVFEIYWWHKPIKEDTSMGAYPNPATVLTWPRLGRQEQFYAIAAVAFMLLTCGNVWAIAHLSLWWLLALPLLLLAYLSVGFIAAGLEYYNYLDQQYDVDL